MSKEILVVKFGTKCLVSGDSIDQGRVNRHAARYATLLNDFRLGIVSSGSEGTGKRKVSSYRPDLVGKLDVRTLAAIGSSGAYHAWERGFGRLKFEGRFIIAAELKATHDNMDDPEEGASLVEVFLNCVNNGIIPVFNINDPLDRHKDEIGRIKEGKDNDYSAEHLSRKVGANTLMLMTARVSGVMIEGEVVPTISLADMSAIEPHLTETDDEGTGSMISKVRAGFKAIEGGVNNVFIGNSSVDPRLILDRQEGTQLVA